MEKVYKIDSVGIKPIYENQLLPNEIKNMTLENFIELLKELEEYEKELIELASQIDYVEKAVEITGIGYMSMVGIIAGNLRKYEHAKQVLKMSGLSLKESSSGQKKKETYFQTRSF